MMLFVLTGNIKRISLSRKESGGRMSDFRSNFTIYELNQVHVYIPNIDKFGNDYL